MSSTTLPEAGPAAAPRIDVTRVAPGFDDPVHAAQRVFRRVLDAMARPGRWQTLPAADLAPLAALGGTPSLAAVLLALLDAETTLHQAGDAGARGLADALRFHTGVRLAAGPEAADFVIADAARADAALWGRLAVGSDAAPQDGATLLLDLEADVTPNDREGAALTLSLTGPGIAERETLALRAPGAAFWRARIADEASFPRGADLLLCRGDAVLGIPRSTRLTIVEDR